MELVIWKGKGESRKSDKKKNWKHVDRVSKKKISNGRKCSSFKFIKIENRTKKCWTFKIRGKFIKEAEH